MGKIGELLVKRGAYSPKGIDKKVVNCYTCRQGERDLKKLTDRKRKWIERTVNNDRSYKLFLYNRFFLFLVCVLLQIVGFCVLWWLFVYDSAAGIGVQIVLAVLELVFVLYIINKTDRPSQRLNWILLILLVPAFGVPMYLVYGEGRATRKMRKKIASSQTELRELVEKAYGAQEIPSAETRSDALGRYIALYGGYPSYKDGDVEYFNDGGAMFPKMLEALRAAKQYILLDYFIIAPGKMWSEIRKILLEKAESGVKIRIIYDDFGSMMTLPPKYDKYLERLHENVKCMTFNDVVPLFAVRMNNRDHRKILVVDGEVAFTGGLNLADEYIGEKRRFGHWKDSGVRITGNAVRSFVCMFFYIWNAFRSDKESVLDYLPPKLEQPEREQVRIQPYDDSPLDKNSVGESVYVDIINRAKRYVYIFTPYLILDDYMRMSLCHAAARGVDVRIVTPGIPDKKMIYRLTRANYMPLLKHGIKIYEYTPGFLHAKSMVCDDECAVVGTINLDYRSLYLHFENAVYFSGCQAVTDVRRDCEETFAVSKACTVENSKRGIFGRLTDSLLRVFETLF